MTQLNANQKLPGTAVVTLRELDGLARQAGSTANRLIKGGTWESALLDGYIAKLHYAGWTLQAIGDALGVSRERIRQRCVNATEVAYSSPELPHVDAWSPPQSPRKTRKPRLRPAFQQWLCETYALASSCRGSHAIGSPPRVASEQVWAAINETIAQGISGAEIARVVGVEARTIYAGLKRHGYRRQAPSQAKYMAKQWRPTSGGPRTHCKRGHEFTPENTYVAKQGRLCRKCARMRSKLAYERKKGGQLATVTDLPARRSA